MAIQHRNFQPRALVQRGAIALGIMVFFLWLLLRRLQGLDLGALRQAVESVGLGQILAALVATGVSFWAVGRYDLALHRHLATGTAPRRAARAGIVAIAISQTLGLGLVTGTLVRWRMLPELGLAAAGRLTLAVTLGFLAGWLAVTSLVLAVLGPGPWQAFGVAGLGLCLIGWGLALHPRAPRLWPNALTLWRCVLLAGLDLGAAGLALWALLPGELAFSLFIPAFLLAFGAGLLSGTPAGLGVFEVSLLALLPGSETALLAAVLIWRLVYFALPAGLAAGFALVRPPRPRNPPQRRTRRWVPRPAGADLAQDGPLEWRAEGLLLGRTRHLLVGLDGTGVPLRWLQHLARAEGRRLVLYHAPPRLAVQARRLGMRVIPVAHEAVIAPLGFRLDLPARASLRRKLRKAQAAGVQVEQAGAWKPLPQMARIAREWAQAHGGERGFSIGGWSSARLAGQRVWLASDAGGIVAFVSFAVGADGWKLDMIRHQNAVPDGTIQALICAAVAQAGREGVERLSLDHVPDPLGLARALPGALGRPIAAALERGSCGLRQFKQGFAPRWEPRYLCAPTAADLALAGVELALALSPRPMAPAPSSAPSFPGNVQPMHDDHAESGFALAAVPWQDRTSDSAGA